MRNFSKKIIAGLLGGALLFTGVQTFAAPDTAPDKDAPRHMMKVRDDGKLAKHLSEKYGVDAAQVESALKDGVHIEDVKTAAVLAKLSGKSFSEVLTMKVDWPQVAEKLGISREEVKKFLEQERDEALAKRTGLDVNTLQSLIKDGYDPRDIDIAAKIAKASGKNVKTVLEKRKINNTWEDVAKSFGVDIKKIMPPPPHHRDR